MDYSKYFDWAATSPLDEEIAFSALKQACQFFGNPSAVHCEGVKARNLLEQTRKKAASILGVSEQHVFFTSGGTESDHIPLLAQLSRPKDSFGKKGTIIISGIEHPALREQSAVLKNEGFSVVCVNPDSSGFVSPEKLKNSLTDDTVFVSVMAVNNETGCVQDIAGIGKMLAEEYAGKRKPHFHTDCVQAAGKILLDLSDKNIDSAALSAHKIMGPRGIGILVLKKNIKPFLCGGGQERGFRSGTENLFGALVFTSCLEKFYLNKNKPEDEKLARLNQQFSLTEYFINELCKIPGCKIIPETRTENNFSGRELFSPYVLQVSFNGIPGNVMVRALDSMGFSISTGSACSAKKQSRPILEAMGLNRQIQDTAVRFSFGPFTERKEIEDLLDAVKKVAEDFCL